MDAKIVRRIEQQLGIPGVVSALAELPPSDLQTLMLELSRLRTEEKEPAMLLSEWERNRFVRPAGHPPERFAAIERAFFASLPQGAEPLTLSPVAPLGSCATIATVSQHKVVSAERGTEVLADPTNVLALECALRRRTLLRQEPRSRARVSLAAVQRVVRAQALDRPDLVPHFGIAALCTAGRDPGGAGFELAAVREHLGALAAWVAAIDPDAPVEFRLTPLEGSPPEDTLRAEVMEPICAEHPHASAVLDPDRESGRGYYRCVCFKVHTRIRGSARFELGDGGATDWTAQLLSNRKERLVISGAGLERVAAALSQAPAQEG